MRIVVDLQGAQATNARRGIGIYTTALLDGLVTSGAHEIVVVMNGRFGESVDALTDWLRSGDRNIRIVVWEPPVGVQAAHSDDPGERSASEVLLGEFVAALRPDVLLVPSLFEGFVDAAITTIPADSSFPTAVVLYDLIPLLRRDAYLTTPALEAWYEGRIGKLRRADLLLAISEATRREALQALDLPDQKVVTIGAAVHQRFHPGTVAPAAERQLRQRLGLARQFVMYTGGIDPRKNVEGLIAAYALLPADVRSTRQLAIVCDVEPTACVALRERCAAAGLAHDEVVFTGYVTDDDLVALYRLCEVAVFPSLHEGFGLPALEAMSCGRPVIASSRSSLPEVIGRDDALFDPEDPASIADKLQHVLQDDAFRDDLARHGLERSTMFSWRSTAERTIAALADVVDARQRPLCPPSASRPKLAYLSPLPPEASGISDYSALLLPHLWSTYDIEVITDQPTITDPWVAANCPARSVEWFAANHRRYDRIVYHVGNSTFHSHMFELMERIPGVIVLHDFFLSGILAHDANIDPTRRPWTTDLYYSHGYAALTRHAANATLSESIFEFPTNLDVLQQALGVIAHSNAARQLADTWYGPGSADDWRIVPMPRSTSGLPERSAARARQHIDDDELLVCAFGMVGPTKLSDRLVTAWAMSALGSDERSRLVFVGEAHDPAYTERLHELIDSIGRGRVSILGRVSPSVYRDHLAAADIGVQLRALSRGETSASAHDCLAAGLPTIVNANGSLTELPDDVVLMLDDDFTDDDLRQALERLQGDAARRAELGATAQRFSASTHGARTAAEQMAVAIESIWAAPTNRRARAAIEMGRLPVLPGRPTSLRDLSVAVTRTLPVSPRPRQLLVDVSELNVRDVGSGIQRVTRNIVRALLTSPPAGFRVEPVAASLDDDYSYARRFTSALLGVELSAADVPIEVGAGDLFVGLDLQPLVIPMHREFLRRLRRQGVRTAFVVYDLLPILFPEHFYPDAATTYTRWLETAVEADALVSISRSVRDDVQRWLDQRQYVERRPNLSWFHLGSDLDGHLLDGDGTALAGHRMRGSFLMVGTIEPRKCHAQVLDGFEALWARGEDVELHIVGKPGWMMESFLERLRSHSEAGRRLHYSSTASDAELTDLYRRSTALIAASSAEGFGLPLIEAAEFGLPVIARNIPVFREVIGDHAVYFDGAAPGAISEAVMRFLTLDAQGAAPQSSEIPRLTWADSARQLMDAVLGRDVRITDR